MAPLGSGGASCAICGVPSPSKQRTVKMCLPFCMSQSYRHITRVWQDKGVRSSAGIHSPLSTRSSTFDMPRMSAWAMPPMGTRNLPCRLCNHHIRCDGIGYGTRFHARFAVPTARHPVPGFPVIDRLKGFYPFGLFHAVAVGDIHPQRETMLFRKRKTIHASAKHDAAATSDGFQGHNLIEAIGGVDFQMRCGRL